MSVEQSLVGAMGCASWRARYQLREYIDLAPSGAVIRGGTKNPPTIASSDALGLNEVGVTDSVMTTLWRCGPKGATFAVSSGAEANHLGADIAIVHTTARRLVLYQAKLARLVNGRFELKSKVTVTQARMLLRRSVRLNGVPYAVAGRLALYQADSTPFITSCRHWFEPGWPYSWPWEPAPQRFSSDPAIGREYYREVLVACGCSPSGIVAAAIGKREAIETVAESETWPWEFDTHEWLKGSSPLDHRGSAHATVAPGVHSDWSFRGAPEFDSYSAQQSAPDVNAAGIASELAVRLKLPMSHRLYVITI